VKRGMGLAERRKARSKEDLNESGGSMDRKEVKSSLLMSVGYDPETQVLEVQFGKKRDGTPGNIYQYADVPAEVYLALLTAESIGKYFLGTIKPKYTCTKIEPEKIDAKEKS
jgi:hypothetical protein